MNRRLFLRAGLGLAAAPAVVRFASLMPPRVIETLRIIEGTDEAFVYPGPTLVAGQFNTTFAELTAAQKKIWADAVWKAARENRFWRKFMGRDPEQLVLLS